MKRLAIVGRGKIHLCLLGRLRVEAPRRPVAIHLNGSGGGDHA